MLGSGQNLILHSLAICSNPERLAESEEEENDILLTDKTAGPSFQQLPGKLSLRKRTSVGFPLIELC